MEILEEKAQLKKLEQIFLINNKESLSLKLITELPVSPELKKWMKVIKNLCNGIHAITKSGLECINTINKLKEDKRVNELRIKNQKYVIHSLLESLVQIKDLDDLEKIHDIVNKNLSCYDIETIEIEFKKINN